MSSIASNNGKRGHVVKPNRFRMLYRYRFVYLMALPMVVYYVMFHYMPMYGIVIAFKDFNVFQGILGSPWVGFKYFKQVFDDVYFWKVVRNTVEISLLKLLFGFPVPILIALLLNEVSGKHFKRTVQTIIYLPHFISWVILSGIILSILSANGGMVNEILKMLGITPKPFMMMPMWFRPIVVVSEIWKTAGWGCIIYIAAINGINPELYEAAVMDGAGRFRQAVHITLPGIRSMIVLLFILSVSGILNAGFDQIFVLYNDITMEVGDIIDTYVFRTGLQMGRYSYATAVGIFKSLISLILIIGFDRLFKSMGENGLF